MLIFILVILVIAVLVSGEMRFNNLESKIMSKYDEVEEARSELETELTAKIDAVKAKVEQLESSEGGVSTSDADKLKADISATKARLAEKLQGILGVPAPAPTPTPQPDL